MVMLDRTPLCFLRLLSVSLALSSVARRSSLPRISLSLSLASHYLSLSLSHRQVDGAVVSSIGRGILVLVGVAHGDGPADVDWVARKLLSARLFPSSSAPASSSSEGGGEEGAPSSRWGSSVSDLPDGEILCVSQFTLLGSLKKGTRPDFKAAAAPAEAAETYGALLDRVREGFREPGSVKDGVFGAMMKVRSDGKERERRRGQKRGLLRGLSG